MLRVLSDEEVAEATKQLIAFCKKYDCNMGNIQNEIRGIAEQMIDEELEDAVKRKGFTLHGKKYRVIEVKGGLHG